MKLLRWEESCRMTISTPRRTVTNLGVTAIAIVIIIALRHQPWVAWTFVVVFLAFGYLWSCWAAAVDARSARRAP